MLQGSGLVHFPAPFLGLFDYDYDGLRNNGLDSDLVVFTSGEGTGAPSRQVSFQIFITIMRGRGCLGSIPGLPKLSSCIRGSECVFFQDGVSGALHG